MDITYNKVDQTQLPINPSRVSASEYNQIAGSLMYIINASGLTPDSQNNEQLLNALKATIISFPYIVETYSNGTSWYRIWSDGWCEQGGRFESNDGSSTTVSFLQEFLDTNYILVGLTYGNQGLDQYVNGWKVVTLNTSSAVIKNNTNGTNSFMWRACGYIS